MLLSSVYYVTSTCTTLFFLLEVTSGNIILANLEVSYCNE